MKHRNIEHRVNFAMKGLSIGFSFAAGMVLMAILYGGYNGTKAWLALIGCVIGSLVAAHMEEA